MAEVFLGLGSNIERERYLAAGLDALDGLFGSLALSPVYNSPAIGFSGQPFLNMVLAVQTELPVGDLFQQLRHIEFEHGRPRNASRFTPRQLDIDILTYDHQVGEIDGVQLPRAEILENAFVLRPLADLAPHSLHPVERHSYAQLWANYDQQSQPLERVDFSWRGRQISVA